MTVKELIEKLSTVDNDTEVCLVNNYNDLEYDFNIAVDTDDLSRELVCILYV
jgi:hypothetical protein